MMDFKDWEKTSEDKKSVTLKHPKGHSMTIALKGLSRIQQEAIKRLKMAEGGPVLPGAGSAQDSMRKSFKFDQGGEASPPSTIPAANITINAAQPPQQSTQPAAIQVPQSPANPNVLMKSGSFNAPAAAQAGQQAIDLSSQVAAEKAKAEAVYQQQFLNERQRLNNVDSENINNFKNHTDDFANYIKANPINPRAYQESMGSGKKIATGLGLLLSGAGSGLAHQNNMAMDFLNKQIDRDIDAQKSRSDQAKTIWGAYNQLYGDQNIATNLAKVSMNDMLVHQAELTAAQLGTPTAQANALALKAQKAAENNKLYLDSAGLLQSTPNVGPVNSEKELPPQGRMKSANPNQKLVDEGIISGAPSAQASIKPKAEESDYYENKLLSPDAEEKLNTKVQFGTPQARKDYPEVLNQYTKAQQVEKQIKQINDLFPKLREEATLSGNLRSHINPHAFGAVGAVPGALIAGGGIGALTGGSLALPAAAAGAGAGAALGEGVAHGLSGTLQATGGQKEVQYQTDKAGLAKFLIGALGNQATGSEIDSIVESNTPAYWDNEKTYNKKLENIKKFLLNRTDTSLLERYKLTPKR